jgi:hypothetical protein
MNKRRNKSVTKTKHRVQKTKRSRRLNKNRSVKGIRGNNKTKVVGKRRNIVQRGGGRIDDLVGRIFALNKLTDPEERSAEIKAILRDIEPENFLQIAHDRKQSKDVEPTGPTLLYAACRLTDPSVELVGGILAKMKVKSDRFSFRKSITGAPRSVTMYTIIPNGVSNGSYPQHAAVQAAKDILDQLLSSHSITTDSQLPFNHRIQRICDILNMLKSYDQALASHIDNGKKVMTPTGELTAVGYTHTPIMNKKNHLSNGAEYTAYDEYVNGFGATPSLRDRLQRSFIPGGHGEGSINIDEFDRVLAPTGTVSVGASAATLYSTVSGFSSAAQDTWFSRIYGFQEMFNETTSNVNRLMKLSKGNQERIYLTYTDIFAHESKFDAGIPLYKSTGLLLYEANSIISENPVQPIITYREINADVKKLHANSKLAGSLFQVASQFNSLEMATPDHTPEMGITIYQHDRTQGPFCAMACPTGTLYRNNFMMNISRDKSWEPQTETNQINTLETIIKKFKDSSYKVNFVVKNGYILPATIADSNKLNTLLDNPYALEQMVDDVNYVIQEDVPVLLETNKETPHKVSQIYCSGFPLAYCISTAYNDGLLGPQEQAIINAHEHGDGGGVKWYAYINRNLIKMITTAMFTATLSHAVNMTKTQQKRVKVFLTLVGTGVFGADTKFIRGIMGNVIRKYRHFPIDLYLVNFAEDQDFPLALPPELNIDQVNPLLSDYPSPSASPSAALPAAAASELPEGWFKYYHEKTGKYYYGNPSKNMTQWERPVSTVPHSAAAVTDSSLLESGGRGGTGEQPKGTLPFLPAGFYPDDFKGHPYYVYLPPWTLKRDPVNKQNVYYQHPVTKEIRSLDNPPDK